MKKAVNNDYTDLVRETTQIEYKQPALYQVLVHNDDFTPMEFVVDMLERIFFMDRQQATDTMFEAHTSGHASCGVYTQDVAVSKVSKVVEHARVNEHPLIFTVEAF